ncbi:hypothetical protein RV18_GL002924 [Enterococcus termitis]|nr:hypothetical protein RV18_GL002924 [Enterococcus termitis]
MANIAAKKSLLFFEIKVDQLRKTCYIITCRKALSKTAETTKIE